MAGPNDQDDDDTWNRWLGLFYQCHRTRSTRITGGLLEAVYLPSSFPSASLVV